MAKEGHSFIIQQIFIAVLKEPGSLKDQGGSREQDKGFLSLRAWISMMMEARLYNTWHVMHIVLRGSFHVISPHNLMGTLIRGALIIGIP